ncbi:hypothetical protein D3C80_684650 [compost metagenome]
MGIIAKHFNLLQLRLRNIHRYMNCLRFTIFNSYCLFFNSIAYALDLNGIGPIRKIVEMKTAITGS